MSPSQHTVFLVGPEQLELRECPIPSPSGGELLVRIEAATTCGTDVKVYRRGGHPRMLAVPGPFGHEMSGVIVETGSGAGEWKSGDPVVIANSASCGQCDYCRNDRENLCRDLQYLSGAFSEHILVPRRFAVRSTYRRPAGLHPHVAAMTEPLACVMHGLEVLDARPGSEVAVFGAGSIGLLFVSVLAAAGHRVVLADPNQSRLELASAFGGSSTILMNRSEEDLAMTKAAASDPAGFDIAIDATGSPLVWKIAASAIRPAGIALFFGGCAPGSTLQVDAHQVHYSEQTLRGSYHHRPPSFRRALEALASGTIPARLLLSSPRPLSEVEEALQSMILRETLKAVIEP